MSSSSPNTEAVVVPSLDAGEATPPPPVIVDYVYSCKVCRTPLFKEEERVLHDNDKNAKGNKNFKRKNLEALGDAVECTSYFLDPLVTTWVSEEEQAARTEGAERQPDTLYCFKCAAKLGTQSWVGTQCSCGAWVTPAFKVLAKAVDRTPIYEGD